MNNKYLNEIIKQAMKDALKDQYKSKFVVTYEEKTSIDEYLDAYNSNKFMYELTQDKVYLNQMKEIMSKLKGEGELLHA